MGGNHHHPRHQRSHSGSPDTALRHVMGLCCLPTPRGFACTSWVHCQMQCPQSGVGVASSPEALPAAGSPRSRASNPAQPSPHSFSCQMRTGGEKLQFLEYSHQRHKSAVLQSQGSGVRQTCVRSQPHHLIFGKFHYLSEPVSFICILGIVTVPPS